MTDFICGIDTTPTWFGKTNSLRQSNLCGLINNSFGVGVHCFGVPVTGIVVNVTAFSAGYQFGTTTVPEQSTAYNNIPLLLYYHDEESGTLIFKSDPITQTNSNLFNVAGGTTVTPFFPGPCTLTCGPGYCGFTTVTGDYKVVSGLLSYNFEIWAVNCYTPGTLDTRTSAVFTFYTYYDQAIVNGGGLDGYVFGPNNATFGLTCPNLKNFHRGGVVDCTYRMINDYVRVDSADVV